MLEGELGGPFYRQPEAVAVNGDFRRWLRWCSARSGVIRESSTVMEVHGSVLVLIGLGLEDRKSVV